MESNRIVDLDVLRVAAIILVLLGHLPGYFPDYPLLDWIYYAFTSLGVGLFVFVSGFVLTHQYMYRERFQPSRFLKKRLIRVYSLYIPALVLFVTGFHYLKIHHKINLSPLAPTLVVHLFAGQALLFPWVNQIFTLWFIGLIVFFYVCFGLIALCRTRYQVIAAIALTGGIILLYRLVLGVVDIRVFLYYPVFLIGVFLRRQRVISLHDIGNRWGVFFMVICVVSYVIFRRMGLAAVRNGVCGSGLLSCVPNLALVQVYVLSGTMFLWWLSSKGIEWLSKEIKRVVFRMSVASYAVYLFHRPVLAAFWWFGENVIGLKVLGKAGVFPVLVAGLFVVGYWIQQGSNWVIGKALG
jgi:peptidoglycan/LPS O-acetylase OafA/YrhL